MVKRMYLNTSILIRAVLPGERGHREAREFLRVCCRVYRCVVSSVHRLERWKSYTKKLIDDLLRELDVEEIDVDLDEVVREASRYVVRHRLSPRKVIDVAHLIAAKKIGCRAIAAVDRFIKSRAKSFGLLYLNHYTGCIDP